jgi:predicted site-specific integrase-resolvase
MHLLSPIQAARALGISVRTAQRFLERGILKGQRVGGSWVVEARSIADARPFVRGPGRPAKLEASE